MFRSKRELTNVLSILVFCADDNSILLLFDDVSGDYWIPSFKMDGLSAWKDNLETFKKKLFDYEIIIEKLLKVYKIWTVEKDFYHLLFQVNLPKEIKSKCQTETKLGKVMWFSCPQIANLKPFLRSLEILEVTHDYIPRAYKNLMKITGETFPIGCLTEITEKDILVSAENTDSQPHLDLLESAGLPSSEQYNLYEDFFLHTYPCIYMNQVAFEKAIKPFKFGGDLKILYRAADVWNRGFLTFQDYLYLIAVMDPYTAHCGHVAEIRCQYIFRYYCSKENGILNYSGFQNLIHDIELERNPEANTVEVDKQIEIVAKAIGFKADSYLNFDQFYSHVLETNIRGTTLLLRCGRSHIDLSVSDLRESVQHGLNSGLLLSLISYPLKCAEFKSDGLDYTVEVKTVILKPGENPLQIKDLRLLEDTMTKSVAEDYKALSNIRVSRADSIDLEVKINELFIALRYFATEICESAICCGECEFEEKEAFTWGSAYIENLGITLIMVCEKLKEIMSAEPRLLEIEAPVFIMGDLHGNFHDLICFEKTLWPNGMTLAPTKLLFLGDYVDRGLNSLEVVMYLFANKLQNPNKLYLIRGNHEIRDIQKLFTFQRECVYKLGSTLGMTVWKAVNDVFDTMPLAAIVDHKIFCCHGGIPPPWLCPWVSVINLIPCPLVQCERQSPLAWTLMWNDPIRGNAPRNTSQDLELISNEGFIPNVPRGTAFAFSCEALDRFLKTNNLSHVVRAHEVVKAGFQVHQKGKLLTVFSSSGYCGGRNFAGSILVADRVLRVFMVDTGIN